VTADFAMQNVLLQIGLRVVAPGGLAISRLSRHVLRCSACFLVTKVRLFKHPLVLFHLKSRTVRIDII
jgi:rRNA maturation endonuclease Nob1